MPFLALVHLLELRCPECGLVLAPPGARSFVVDERDEAINFSQDDPPESMTVEIVCPNGHRVARHVPEELAAEEALSVPDDAPIARDAVFVPLT
jgi:hypothetical protein